MIVFVLDVMKKLRLIFFGAFLTFSIVATAPGGEQKNEAPIGTAEMKSDRTIVLRLRAEFPGGGVGEGFLEYPPTHPDYKEILEHVGPLAPGQTVLVRPWH